MIVLDALGLAIDRARAGSDDSLRCRRITGRDVSDAFRAHVKSYFNDPDEARELLDEWGLRSSEDLGRIVFALADAGWVRRDQYDVPAEFAGLFTLETLF